MTQSRLSVPARAALGALLVVLMLVGIVVLGRVASSDVMAMALTTVFFLVLAAGLLVVVRRRHELLLPLGGVYVLVAGGAGVLLGLPLVTDDVVDEEVVVATEPKQELPAASDAPAAQAAPTALASGRFEAGDHPGEGTATLVDTGDSAVLTLTDFATDNGPDLLVYLVPGDAPAGSVEGFVDLGVLKGNIGDQQYDVPEDVDAGAGWRVVVWCRAFAVTFTQALLA